MSTKRNPDFKQETLLLKNPDAEKKLKKFLKPRVIEASSGQKGRPVVYLPRLSPKDMYFLYNPDHYYQLH
jgi:hypothetical protein